ncbi:unnamed protein product [Peronospora belbahrii]|uniref:Uncharacterized protein n=1 Tax=Peronospora belbahrii TaxID=622444 RepID=A0AAU9L4K2_9STRA|nr:unnamed protein product [Peronospora belbahrii]CAH0521977.1 unnamed protein product [Peronospora belbahrii]
MAISRSIVPTSASSTATKPLSVSIDISDSKLKLVEMPQQMLQHVEKINDFEHVKYLKENMRAFEATASSYRPRSSQPLRLPTDKTTAASSTGIGGANEENIQGRLTARELRTLLRLYYENPESWTPQVLADKYGLDVSIMCSILNSVGPPNVLPPKGASEYPFGVWFDAPGSSSLTHKRTSRSISH